MQIPSIEQMLQSGVHFGHQTSRWHPKMKPFIFTQRNGVHIINLEKTQAQLEETLSVVKDMAAQGKTILFVSTKPQARSIVKKAAQECGMPYLVDRWIGGMLTNFQEIKKLIEKYKMLTEQKETGELEKYTKKEQLEITKELEKMSHYLGGLVDLNKLPDAIFVPALQREKTAVVEANKVGVPIIGITDTNANPDKAAYIIPANDDAVKAIDLMVNTVKDAIAAGKTEFDKQEKTIADK